MHPNEFPMLTWAANCIGRSCTHYFFGMIGKSK
jgi:hypothetical protein